MLTLGSGTIYAAAWYTGGQVQPPTAVGLAQTASGGALSNGTYYVQVTAFNANGESQATAEQSIVLNGGGAVQKITVTFTAPVAGPAPTGYRVYIALATPGFASAQGTTAASPYNQTASLVTNGAQASLVGLLSLGEVAGDGELSVTYQDKKFFGQSIWPIAQAFYGGSASLKVKKVELNLDQLQILLQPAPWSQLGTVGSGSDVYTITSLTAPRYLYCKFLHTRSDDSTKTVLIEGFKVVSKQLMFPFAREDFAQLDLDFEFMTDSSLSNKAFVVTATQ
jgi:hypothetical protein